MVGNIVVLLDEFFAERLDEIDRGIGGEPDMAAGAVGGIAREFDHLLADQCGFADQRRGDALALEFLEHSRAFFLVDVDEDRIGSGGLDLADVGGEIGLTGLGGEIGCDLDTVAREFLGYDVASALAEIVVDPDDRHRFGLEFVIDVFGDLRHRRLLAERGAEQELVAGLRQFGSFPAHDLRDTGFGCERCGDLDRSRVTRTEQDVGLAIERLLNLRARHAGVRLGIGMGDFQLVAENAALRIDFLDRQIDAVLPVGTDGGAAAGQFGDVGQFDGWAGLGEHRSGQDRGEQRAS